MNDLQRRLIIWLSTHKESRMRVVLVPVADRPECARALKAAFGVAQAQGADLVGCHIRPHRDSAVRMPGLGSGTDAQRAAASRDRDPKRDSRNARTLFEKAATEAGFRVASRPRADGTPVAIWQERVGSPDRVMPIVGPMSDLIVLSRPTAKGGRRASVFLMEAVMHGCRPILLLPQRPVRQPGKNILVAWNQSEEASRAVAAALPLLTAASAVTLAVAGDERAPGPKASHVVHYLRHHGVQADVLKTKGKHPVEELEQGYQQAGADLLVMGAYSRHRLRERIFGGVTDHMLRRSNLPVFLYHSGG
jgi:nucleotide-binding universal stress UspA family protein